MTKTAALLVAPAAVGGGGDSKGSQRVSQGSRENSVLHPGHDRSASTRPTIPGRGEQYCTLWLEYYSSGSLELDTQN